jgi:hypothetical protein
MRVLAALGLSLLAAFALAADRVAAPAGTHTLQLVFADYLHQAFDPVLQSHKITITVK